MKKVTTFGDRERDQVDLADKIAAAKGEVLRVFEAAAAQMEAAAKANNEIAIGASMLEVIAPVVATAVEQALKKVMS